MVFWYRDAILKTVIIVFGARRAAEQFQKLRKILDMLGLEKARVRQEFISAAESPKFVQVVKEMVEQVRRFGPNPFRDGETRYTAKQFVPGSVEEITI